MKEDKDTSANAWLLLAAGGNRQHAGNDGYEDEPDAHYSWDDTVGNHARVAVGDRIAMWDKNELMGVSIVEDIAYGSDVKLVHKCPVCSKAGIKQRKSLRPKFRCYKCGSTFDVTKSLPTEVKTYRSRHDAAWIDLRGALSGPELRELAVSPGSQLSIRVLPQ